MTPGDLRLWTGRGARIAAVLLTLVGGTAGCAPAGEERTGPEGASSEAGDGTGTPSEATGQAGPPGSWIEGFSVGSGVDTRGAIPQTLRGEEFQAGQRIYVSMEIGEAAPAASVHALFLDASGRQVAEDAKKVPAHVGYLYFDSGDTGDWTPGEGTITLSVDGRQVAEESFTLREPTSAEPAEGQPAPSG